MKWLIRAVAIVTALLLGGLIFIMAVTDPTVVSRGFKLLFFLVWFLAFWGVFSFICLGINKLVRRSASVAEAFYHNFLLGGILSLIFTLLVIIKILIQK